MKTSTLNTALRLTGAAVLLAGFDLPSAPAAASPYFVEHFDAATLNPNLEDPDHAFVIEAGSIHRIMSPGGIAPDSTDRRYVRTIASDYISRGFVAELSLSIGRDLPSESGSLVLFFGIGSGTPDRDHFWEPTPGILMRMHGIACPWCGGQIDVGVFFQGAFDRGDTSLMHFLSADGGFHRARITKQGASVTFAFDENYNGTFVPDATYTITNVLALTPWLNDTNSRIVFGTGNTVDIFDDLSIRGPLVTEPMVLTEESGVASIRLNPEGWFELPATVSYSVTGGTATPGVDFVLTSDVLDLAAGVTNATIPLTVIEDALVVTNCVLTGNSASCGGGASGGTLRNCILTRNSADYGGGAFECTLHNCTLSHNSTLSGGGGGAYGGTLYNCTLKNNPAVAGGGAAWSTLRILVKESGVRPRCDPRQRT